MSTAAAPRRGAAAFLVVLLVAAVGLGAVRANLDELAARDPGLTRAILDGATGDLADLALRENGITHHQADMALLARLAPRARYVLVDVAPGGLAPALLGVADARAVTLGGAWSGEPPMAPGVRSWSGTSRLGPWEVRAGAGRPDTFLVVSDPSDVERTVYLDATLPGAPSPGPGGRTVGAGGPGTAEHPVLREALLLLALLALGGLVLPRDLGPDLGRAVRPAAALIVGAVLPALPALVSVATGLPWRPAGAWVLMFAAVAVGGRAVARHGPVGWRPEDLGLVLPTVGAVLLIVAVVRADGFVAVSPDAFQHLTRAAVLAAGAPDLLLMDPRLLAYRMVATSGLHALGVPLGLPVLLGAGAVIGLATVVLVATVVRRSVTGRVPPSVAATAALVAAALLVTSERMLAMAVYPNAHTLVAGVVLLLLVLRATSTAAVSGAAEAALVLGLTLARPEGGLVAALVLLPGLVRRARDTSWPWATLGVATLAWQLVVLGAQRGAGAAVDPVLLSGGLLLAATALGIAADPRARGRTVGRTATIVAAIGLWAALGLLIVGSEVSRRAAASALAVVVDGTSGWGGTFLRLGAAIAVGAVAAAVATGPRRTMGGPGRGTLPPPVRDGIVFLVAAVPLLLLTAELRGSAFHTGQGDSLVRMWTHLVPVLVVVAVALPVAGLAALATTGAAPAVPPTAPASSPPRRRLAAQALAVAALVLATGPALDALATPLPGVLHPVVTMVPEDATRATDELLTGTTVRAALTLPPAAAALDPAAEGRVCLDLLTATYLRTAVRGAWDVTLTLGTSTGRSAVDVATVRDTEFLATCLDDVTPGDLAAGVLEGATLEVRVVEGARGRAAGLWLTGPPDAEVPVHRLRVEVQRATVLPGLLRVLGLLAVAAAGLVVLLERPGRPPAPRPAGRDGPPDASVPSPA